MENLIVQMEFSKIPKPMSETKENIISLVNVLWETQAHSFIGLKGL